MTKKRVNSPEFHCFITSDSSAPEMQYNKMERVLNKFITGAWSMVRRWFDGSISSAELWLAHVF